MRVFQIEALELPLDPGVEFLEARVKITGGLLHQLEPEPRGLGLPGGGVVIIAGAEEQLAVAMDLFDAGEDSEEAVVKRFGG